MKVLLALMAGLLCVRSASRETCLRHLESCSEEELRKRLELRFMSGNILEVREMMQAEGMCSRARKLDGYFAMLGMIVTDGTWHSRYVEAFEGAELDMGQDEEMIRMLMDEMATGEIWIEVNMKQAVAVVKRLEEAVGNGGEPRDGEPPNVVYHIAWEVEKWLPPGNRTWGRALKALLEKDGVAAGLVERRYNEEARKMASEDAELKDVLYSHVLRRRNLLNAIVDKNGVLAREIVAEGIEGGYWLYAGELEKAMETEGMRELLSGVDVFEKMRVRYGLGEEELSIWRLKELAQEGRLDKLVKKVIRRLARYGDIHDLWELIGTVEGRLFDGLMSSAELEPVLKGGIERLVRQGRIDELKKLIETMNGEIFSGRVFDERTLGGKVFDGLVARGELDTALGEGMEGLAGDGSIDDLRWLAEAVHGRVFDELLSRGKLDAALKEGMKKLVRQGLVHDLWKLIETVEGRVFDGLTASGELDEALREGMEKLLRDGRIADLRRLVEAVDGRVFEVLLKSRESDEILKAGIGRLIRDRKTDDLERLVGIEAVKRKVSDGLVSVGELDGVFREMAKNTTRNGSKDDIHDLMEAVEGGVFDGLVSREVLDEALVPRAGR